jgi:sugar phosphate isomerase/epimerase
MHRRFSLAHLTALDLSPPDLIELAARCGYDLVGLRLIPVGAANEPIYPLQTDRALRARTKAAMKATGLELLDIEVARIRREAQPEDYLPEMEVTAELGGRHVLTSAWCDGDQFIQDFFNRLCELAEPFGLSVDIEFPTWSAVRSLRAAANVVQASGRSNGGIVIDTLHLDRSGDPLSLIDSLPPRWFRFVQICDAPGEYSKETAELIRIGRGARLFLGQGGIDVAAMLRHLPDVPLSVEIPHIERLKELGTERFVRRCLETAKTYFSANDNRATA